MTVKELREALAELPYTHDNANLVVWMPGSKIDLSNFAMVRSCSMRNNEIWFEGNLRPGSALEG